MTDAELIERIAVEVMGADIHKKNRFIAYCAVTKRFWIESENGAVVFDPITDANHSMMVVEKVETFEFVYATRILHAYHPNYPDDKIWLVQFISAIDGELTPVKLHKFLGHAVCLAALEAVRSPVAVVEE